MSLDFLRGRIRSSLPLRLRIRNLDDLVDRAGFFKAELAIKRIAPSFCAVTSRKTCRNPAARNPCKAFNIGSMTQTLPTMVRNYPRFWTARPRTRSRMPWIVPQYSDSTRQRLKADPYANSQSWPAAGIRLWLISAISREQPAYSPRQGNTFESISSRKLRYFTCAWTSTSDSSQATKPIAERKLRLAVLHANSISIRNRLK